MNNANQPMIYMTRAELTELVEGAINRALAKAFDGRRKQEHDIAVGYREAAEKSHISESKLKRMRVDPKYRKAFLQDGAKVLIYVDTLLDIMQTN